MKYVIFDTGPLISLTMNGLLPVLEKLKENFNGEFIITPSVKQEVIDRPMKIKKYKFEAIKIKNLVDRKILKYSSDFISNNVLEKETKKIMKLGNGVLRSQKNGEKISIIHEGEASCIAFARLCKCENVIIIDERSTRLLAESPQNLKKLIARKVHTKISMENSLASEFKEFKFIRSPELMFVAYKKNLIPLKKDKQTLDAILYSLKFKGAAISSKEIEEMKQLA